MRDFKIFYDRDMDAAITTVKPHFNTIAEVLCFSANYAYCLGKKKKIGNDKVEVASGAVEKMLSIFMQLHYRIRKIQKS